MIDDQARRGRRPRSCPPTPSGPAVEPQRQPGRLDAVIRRPLTARPASCAAPANEERRADDRRDDPDLRSPPAGPGHDRRCRRRAAAARPAPCRVGHHPAVVGAGDRAGGMGYGQADDAIGPAAATAPPAHSTAPSPACAPASGRRAGPASVRRRPRARARRAGRLANSPRARPAARNGSDRQDVLVPPGQRSDDPAPDLVERRGRRKRASRSVRETSRPVSTAPASASLIGVAPSRPRAAERVDDHAC